MPWVNASSAAADHTTVSRTAQSQGENKLFFKLFETRPQGSYIQAPFCGDSIVVCSWAGTGTTSEPPICSWAGLLPASLPNRRYTETALNLHLPAHVKLHEHSSGVVKVDLPVGASEEVKLLFEGSVGHDDFFRTGGV